MELNFVQFHVLCKKDFVGLKLLCFIFKSSIFLLLLLKVIKSSRRTPCNFLLVTRMSLCANTDRSCLSSRAHTLRRMSESGAAFICRCAFASHFLNLFQSLHLQVTHSSASFLSAVWRSITSLSSSSRINLLRLAVSHS